MSEIIMLKDVRLSFPHIAEPQRNVNEVTGKERVSYNAEFIMPQDHAGFTQFMARYSDIALNKWKEHAQNVMAMIQTDRKQRCFGLGAEKINRKNFKPYDGYDGNVFITAGRDSLPQLIQADGSAVNPADTAAWSRMARSLYGGCRVNAAIKPWPQDNTKGRGIRCDLIAIQFAGDDTPFGEAAVDASSLFGAVTSAAAVPGFMAQPAASAMPAAPFGAVKMPWEV